MVINIYIHHILQRGPRLGIDRISDPRSKYTVVDPNTASRGGGGQSGNKIFFMATPSN